MLDQISGIPFRKVWSQGTLIAALLPRLPYTYFSCTVSAMTIFPPGSESYVLTSVMATYMLHSVMPCYKCNKCHITQYTWHPIYRCWSNCKALQAGVSQDVLGRACWLPPLSYCLTRSPLFHIPNLVDTCRPSHASLVTHIGRTLITSLQGHELEGARMSKPNMGYRGYQKNTMSRMSMRTRASRASSTAPTLQLYAVSALV